MVNASRMAGPDEEGKTPSPLTVSVVIVAYESGSTLGRCLASLARQTARNFEVLLVDNASTDEAATAAAVADPSLKLIRPGANLGFAAGNNLAARQAEGKWLVMLNPDAYPEPNWLENLLNAAKAFPAVRVFTSRQIMADDPTLLDGLGDAMSGAGIPFRGGYGRPDPGAVAPGEVFSPCGAAMMIDRSLFLDAGGFDESFFCYCEDVDLGYRLRLLGEPTVVVTDAVVQHEGSISSGGPRSEFAVFHGTRNRFWLLVKNTPWPLLPIVLPLHLIAIALIMSRPIGKLQARVTCKALRAAFAGLGPIWASRRVVQRRRRASSWAIARAMTWNPNDVRRMRVVIHRPKDLRSTVA
jgi:GT2 family glycosyltransferase